MSPKFKNSRRTNQTGHLNRISAFLWRSSRQLSELQKIQNFRRKPFPVFTLNSVQLFNPKYPFCSSGSFSTVVLSRKELGTQFRQKETAAMAGSAAACRFALLRGGGGGGAIAAWVLPEKEFQKPHAMPAESCVYARIAIPIFQFLSYRGRGFL